MTGCIARNCVHLSMLFLCAVAALFAGPGLGLAILGGACVYALLIARSDVLLLMRLQRAERVQERLAVASVESFTRLYPNARGIVTGYYTRIVTKEYPEHPFLLFCAAGRWKQGDVFTVTLWKDRGVILSYHVE